MSSKQEIMDDQRFRRVSKDPRFWEMPEKDRKVKIDKRFRAMFHDKKFKLNYAVDKRGRPISHSTTEDLKRFYDLSDSDSDLSDEESKVLDEKRVKEKKKQTKKETKSKTPIEEKKKETKKTDQKDSINKNDLNNSERIQKMKNSHKSPKIDSEVSPKDSEESLQSRKKKRDTTDLSVEASPKGKLRTKDPSTSAMVKSSTVSGSKAKREKQAVIMAKDNAGRMLHEEAPEEDSDSASELGRDEESEGEITSDDRASADDDENEDEEEEEDGEEEEEEEEEEDESDDESDSGPDLARGKGNVETSSEDEDDLADLFPEEPGFEHAWRELDKDAPRADEITRRLAVCNMDWDRLKAKDLLALFNSFKPKGGVVFSVKIYPSEFGKQRMKEEQIQGPVELLSIPEDAPEKDWASREKLRDYQFKRLKYYYAVVECDSPETASKIYEDCDGLEFESSCSFIDLRFIPDDITFDDEPKDAASEVDLTAYKPKYFTSAAMGTSTVEITWDETDHERITTLNRKFKKDELLDMDFEAYLASSSEDEEEVEEAPEGEDGVSIEDGKTKKSQKDDEEQIAKYRQLLQVIQEKEKKGKENDMEMEIKWVPGLKESAEEMVKNKLEGKDKLTPWEQFLEKKKEKKRLKKKQKALAEEASEDEIPSDVDLNDPYFAEEVKKIGIKKKSMKSAKDGATSEEETELEKQKAEMALLVMDEEEDSKKHFNYDKIVEHQNLSKKKKKQLMKKKELLEDDFEVNVSDARFQAMYTSHLFNLDPSDPNFKKTKAMEKILEEKARHREQKEERLIQAVERAQQDTGKPAQKQPMDPALSMLIKSVKNKTEQFQARKKQRIK
ncbi:similar to chromosome 20 open reading frame 6 [Rattus norvegicus]|uniref:ESF1 homolog n=2 Tax=Rattus norvegicus TaxID=10116 RepID=ESF1_RAT|nr:ESF1 homolog [Rattus norvegicus]XP_006235167.1 ESF1 homolog isoform X1 [Rattus norvegicus]XP_006235168.1 ESF1 homolog isoform X1 [Rattus norvegicus]XP_017447439.1 ESF1 homolog isoform X1 [Rattus norvegicus]Q76MT4.1 RecName: Full=ESF1 homolog; AltName: Full=ABT1-associated protein [Rattus norvegicus]BAD10946.1 ABTAP [Rattus rattus]EDL80320.1 similar to chromosome 20 open reading frame 6 [Rattus norvegicus]|eukprot:NP_001094241.1 ESF1 homolog [Rattus norvegicus]